MTAALIAELPLCKLCSSLSIIIWMKFTSDLNFRRRRILIFSFLFPRFWELVFRIAKEIAYKVYKNKGLTKMTFLYRADVSPSFKSCVLQTMWHFFFEWFLLPSFFFLFFCPFVSLQFYNRASLYRALFYETLVCFKPNENVEVFKKKS